MSVKNKKVIINNEERNISGKHLKKPISIWDVSYSKCRRKISLKNFEVTKAYDRVHISGNILLCLSSTKVTSSNAALQKLMSMTQ